MENQIYSGTKNPRRSRRELAHGAFARAAAAEGMVLLKNEGLLPLAPGTPLALLGGGAVRTVKGGTGSGDVNNRKSISVYEGVLDAGAQVTSGNWLADYESRYESARQAWKKKILEDAKHVENPFDAYAANPFSMPEGRKITAEDLVPASAAVYVISRISGEGKDRRREKGDYELSGKEREDLLYLSQMGIPIVLVLNVGAPVGLAEILREAKQIKAVLLISLPGQEGGHAAADVLFGRAAPGGRLTATWAKRYEDYPSAESFGSLNGNLETEEYREGIYVGYRHFDRFGIEPLFPFGYGLSYTSFSTALAGIRETEEGAEIVVRVKNTGRSRAGREVVQVYVTPPQTGIPKEYQRLAGFGKTGLLAPQGEQRLAIPIGQRSLACYSEERSAWIIEAGTYGIWIGEHAASTRLAAMLTVEESCAVERTNTICPKAAAFSDPGGAGPAAERYREWLEQAWKDPGIPRILLTPREEKGKRYQACPAKGQPVEELIPLLYGNITEGASTLGSAGTRVPGSAGETSEALQGKYGIPPLVMADGPAGLRLRQSYEADRETGAVYGTGVLGSLENGFLEAPVHHENTDTYYQYCTAFPVGTALAQSWDPELMQRFGEAIAVEMEEFHVDLWLAPGLNIQRNPLCGRNFEYYSEDPLLSGLLAAAVTDGVQSRRGCGVTVKHFACNNQEDNRMGVDACVSERALREIYLRGFEIVVKKGRPAAMMSAYNRINGVHAANSRDLCTTAAREEWGFGGAILSDWNTTVPEDGSVPWLCAAAGNDIIMPGNRNDAEEIRRAYENGELPEEAIRECAGRVLELVRRLKGEVFAFSHGVKE